jgi:hypothetical protein
MLLPNYTYKIIIKNTCEIKGNYIPFEFDKANPDQIHIIDLINKKEKVKKTPDIILFDDFNHINNIEFEPHTKFYGIFSNKISMDRIFKNANIYDLYCSDRFVYKNCQHVIFFKKRKLNSPEWNLNSSKNSIVFVYEEWGWGDLIRNLRFLEKISIDYKVIFECRKEIKKIVKLYPVEIWDKQSKVPNHDFHVRLEFLNNYFDPFFSKIPINKRIELSSKKTIGINTYSGDLSINNRNFFYKDIHCKALQQFDLWGYKTDCNIKKLNIDYKDWYRTCVLTNSLDLIITSDTSIAHLCGSLDKKCIVVLPIKKYNTIILKETNVYYPKMQIFINDCNLKNNIENYVKNIT